MYFKQFFLGWGGVFLGITPVALGESFLKIPKESSTPIAKIGTHLLSYQDLEDFSAPLRNQEGLYRASEKELLALLAYEQAALSYAEKSLPLEKSPDFQKKYRGFVYQYLLNESLQKEFLNFRPTEQELKSYYLTNPKVRLRQVFLPVPSEASPQILKEAELEMQNIYAQLEIDRKKSPFIAPEWINDHSPHRDPLFGGDLGYRKKSQLDPALYRTACRLKIGEWSGIVRSAFGFHILQLLAKIPLEEVSWVEIQGEFWLERKKDLVQNFHQMLESKIPIQFFKF